MVSFQCDSCADTVKKPQLDKHRQKCRGSFTCLDCSTTFHDQAYKSHTTCISEAEKYQGALFKAPKKGKQLSNQSTSVHVPSTTTPVITTTHETPTSPDSSNIHPSRLKALQSNTFQPNSRMNETSNRGGRNFVRGRGGYGASNRGNMVSGQNTLKPREGTMRSWGSPAVSEPIINTSNEEDKGVVLPSTVSVGMEVSEKKKRKNKGDKGGAGSKAHSKNPKSFNDETTHVTSSADLNDISIVPPVEGGTNTEEQRPQSKKRKRQSEELQNQPVINTTPISSDDDKTVKRIRKNITKLSEKQKGTIALGDWLDEVAQSKGKTLELKQVLKTLQVMWTDGKWILTTS
ncbi:hypothetical protein M231_03189 [Tremella mesenterica]|uniref:Zinc finger C2H2 LYAR-type domain-containing protein n=1 Tax=Tremella mesenterica TaxID=5217 RepID=A0A4Q1BP11_TREME|nr:hypothetical protein M231_03189 [Tremella mesenterica]